MNVLSMLDMIRAWLWRVAMVQEPAGIKVVVAFSGPYFRIRQGALWSRWIGFN